MDDFQVSEATRIIEYVLRQKLPSNFHESLVSGVRLCHFLIQLFPLRPRPKYRNGRPEHYLNNIQSFLNAASSILPKAALFVPEELLNGTPEGLNHVARIIILLSRASGKPIPSKFSFTPNTTSNKSNSILVPNVALSHNFNAVSSDAMSVESSGSSSDWCRVSISSPQLSIFSSPLSPRDSWVSISKKELE